MADVEVKKLPEPAWKAGVKNFLAGGAGGMSLVFVGHPLDTIKVKLQTAEAGQYSGIVDVARKTMKADGVFGLYKGMSAPLAGVTPIFALYFLGFDMGKRIATNIGGPFVKKDGSINNLGIIFGGGFSAIPGTALMVPGDRIKVMLQAGTTTFKGPIEVGAHIVKTEGFAGLYKGTALTLARDGPGSMAYYGAYEVFKDLLSDGDQLSVPAIVTAGGMAGVLREFPSTSLRGPFCAKLCLCTDFNELVMHVSVYGNGSHIQVHVGSTG
eukprot:m.24094 g.24094  ORF g.24094 m.24094 type:complete len:268 (+) comp13013_c0_seq6:219-1022(+)